MKTTTGLLTLSLTLMISTAAPAVTIDLVSVGNVGNAADVTGFGAVDYHYSIGATEVTNAQYAEFLNAVATTDPHSLFSANQNITRTGSSGNFSYTANGGLEQHPVTFVSFWDATRFTNWLHNGQPTGAQGLGTTEDGAYSLNGVTNPVNTTISRETDARWFLPTEDEWYKAAYHQNDGDTGNYFDFPAGSDTAPTFETPVGGANSANYNFAVLTTTPVGAYLGSVSPYGTFDQGGNLDEYTEGIEPGFGAGNRVIRGGTFNSPASLLSSSQRASGVPAFDNALRGFRVATIVPEPSSLLLGALAWVGILVRRRP